MPALRALVLVAALAGTAVPAAAQSYCAGLADGHARLDCYDRAARAPAASPRAPTPLSRVCTSSSPCVGPRGGVYHVTPSGYRRYLPRG
jgi:hypothetical protein